MQPINARNLGPQLEKAAAKFRANSDKRIAKRTAAEFPKASLFHYTTRTAFESIIATEEFRFTSIYHMDDTEELNFGFDTCSAILKSIFERGDKEIKSFVTPLIETDFRQKIKAIIEFYSVSFGTRDDPKQWARYGDKGNGIAIGLSPEFFSSLPIDPQKPEEVVYIGKVAYGEKNAKAQNSRVIHSAVDFIKREYRAGTIPEGDAAASLFLRLTAEMYPEVLWHCVTTKSDTWEHQNETRLLVFNHVKNPKLAIHMTQGRPFVKIRQPTLKKFLDEVMVGPKAEASAETQVRLFLAKQGLGEVRVTRSLST
jgi:hypothetical protein